MDILEYAEKIYRKQFPEVTKLTPYDSELINLMVLTIQDFKFHDLVKKEILNYFNNESMTKGYTIDTGEHFDLDKDEFYYNLTRIDIDNICNKIRNNILLQ